MAWIDRQGRLGGKISVIDLAAVGVVLLVLVGIFLVPGGTGSVAQVGPSRSVEIDMIVRGLSIARPEELVRRGDQASFIVRNQPSGTLKIKNLTIFPPEVEVPQPDGSVKFMADTRSQTRFLRDMVITLAGTAQVADGGAVLGNSKIKVGVPVELEGAQYNLRGSVMDVRVGA
ncbi:hypothetical protein GlitD10_1224 [Gloeomargarita lithophora Alchichica-D10]|uniref:Pyruvate/2-oxoglutarate dehydrogenase complex,dihydrolipoamide dehydrogenase (E3) component n=1 Tax=Gloeomargarita lithophora Alchichica-D10 TaxID=1188229 RepID=A0A1J0AC94_9CYAN|nr:DUF4330 domain-containing protein [Gloeomargarita lithophora]APB33544.1 hypothetical protein GlitD10_1224 [Gloeomargarita lithophora Alchichica-D10]